MQRSGITRKIDELGRIVIPKEMRYNLGIRDGDALEIYVNDNSIVIKKYSNIKKINNLSSNLCELINEIFNVDIIITDRDKVISSNNRNLMNIELDNNLKKLIDNREIYISKLKENIMNNSGYFYIYPVITENNSCGLLIIVTDSLKEEYKKYAKIVQKLLVYQLDIA